MPMPTTCPTMRQGAGTSPSDRTGEASAASVRAGPSSELEPQPELERPGPAGAEDAARRRHRVAEARRAEISRVRRVVGVAGEHVRVARVVARGDAEDVRHVEEVEDLRQG